MIAFGFGGFDRTSYDRKTIPSIRLRHGRADPRGPLDLVPEFRVDGRSYLERMVISALPGADRLPLKRREQDAQFLMLS